MRLLDDEDAAEDDVFCSIGSLDCDGLDLFEIGLSSDSLKSDSFPDLICSNAGGELMVVRAALGDWLGLVEAEEMKEMDLSSGCLM